LVCEGGLEHSQPPQSKVDLVDSRR
jgi:hypothetical protein